MNTQISVKFAAIAVALMMNSLLIVGVAYLFNAPTHQPTTVLALTQTVASTSVGAV
jgi:hypothetical protein